MKSKIAVFLATFFITITAGVVAQTVSIHDMSDTWTDGGTTYDAIKMNVTDTASAADSKLLNLQVDAAPTFYVDKDGDIGFPQQNARIWGVNGLIISTQSGATTIGKGTETSLTGGITITGGSDGNIITTSSIDGDYVEVTGKSACCGGHIPGPLYLRGGDSNSASAGDLNGAKVLVEGGSATHAGTGNGGNVNLKMGEHATGGGVAGKIQFLAPDDSVVLSVDETGLLDVGTGNDLSVKLGDSAGANTFSIYDSSGTEQTYIDSDGTIGFTGWNMKFESLGNFILQKESDALDAVVTFGSRLQFKVANGDTEIVQGGGTDFILYGDPYPNSPGTIPPGAMIIQGQSAHRNATVSPNIEGGDLSLFGGLGAANATTQAAHGGNVNISGGTPYGTGVKGSVNIDSYNTTVKLGDAAGARKLSITDSADAEVAYVNSDGAMYLVNSFTLSDFSGGLWVGGTQGSDVILGDSATQVSSTALGDFGLTWKRGTATDLILGANTHATDVATGSLTVFGQSAYASAVTNLNGGHLKLRGGNKATGGGTRGSVQFLNPADDSVQLSVNGDGVMYGHDVDGASAVGHTFDTASAYSTSGAKLLSLKNNGTEEFYVDKDGKVIFDGSFGLTSDDNQLLLSNTDGAMVNFGSGGGYIRLYKYVVMDQGTPSTNHVIRGGNSGTNSGLTIAAGSLNVLQDYSVNPLYLLGGSASPDAATNLDGGVVNVTAGAGSSSSAGDADGGAINITGGIGYGTGDGGNVVISGGAASGSGVEGNIQLNSQITVETYERHVQIPANAVSVGATAPAYVTVNTAIRCLEFDEGEEAFIQVEIPSDWDGASDIRIEIDWLPNVAGLADTNTVVWSFDWLSRAEGEDADTGSVSTGTGTYTSSGATAQGTIVHTSMILDYDDATNPLTKEDHAFIHFTHDATSTFNGKVCVTALEQLYNSIGLPRI